jgi:hypothetical protein
VLGLGTALYLVGRDVKDMTLLEAEQLAAGSSSRSGGVIETQYVEPLDVELRARSMQVFRDPGPPRWAAAGIQVPLMPQRVQAAMLRLDQPLGYVMPMVMDYVPHSGGEGVCFRHESPVELFSSPGRRAAARPPVAGRGRPAARRGPVIRSPIRRTRARRRPAARAPGHTFISRETHACVVHARSD